MKFAKVGNSYMHRAGKLYCTVIATEKNGKKCTVEIKRAFMDDADSDKQCNADIGEHIFVDYEVFKMVWATKLYIVPPEVWRRR